MSDDHDLYTRIYNVVRSIPAGKVASYGQVAALVGSPRSARIVGWALRQLPAETNVPWWRVLNAAGMISIENLDVPKVEQARLLEAEGVEITNREGNVWVDLKKNGWSGTV